MRPAHADPSGASPVIVPIDASHAVDFHTVWDAVARESRFLSIQEAPPLDEVEAFVRTNLAVGNPHLVAFDAGRLVGWCDIVRHTRHATAHRGSASVGVLSSHRGRGLGERLLGQALAMAWNEDFKRVELIVRADNVRAIALYRRLGFEMEGLRRKSFMVDGVFHDLVDMAILHPAIETGGVPCGS